MTNDDSNTPNEDSNTPTDNAESARPESVDSGEVHDGASDAPAAEPTPSTDAVPIGGTREQVRERAAQVIAKQRRNRWLFRGIGALALIAVIATIAIVVTSVVSGAVNKPAPSPAGLDQDGIRVEATGVALPSGAGNGTITSTAAPTAEATDTAEATPTPAPTGPRTNAVEIRIYLDYLSPEAATFQRANAKQLALLIGDGAVAVTYHPVATLASKTNGTKYSLRAAGAAACVATYAPDFFFAYNYELLAKQPKPNSDGLSDDELADLAIAVGSGSPEGLRTCITNGTFEPWVKSATERALNEKLPGAKDKLTQTPTILVNGAPYIGAMDDPAEFIQFVMTRESNADTTPSATPTPTPSVTETPAAEEATPAETPAETPAVTEPTPAS